MHFSSIEAARESEIAVEHRNRVGAAVAAKYKAS
jgi:hypothetical protein